MGGRPKGQQILGTQHPNQPLQGPSEFAHKSWSFGGLASLGISWPLAFLILSNLFFSKQDLREQSVVVNQLPCEELQPGLGASFRVVVDASPSLWYHKTDHGSDSAVRIETTNVELCFDPRHGIGVGDQAPG